LFIPEKSSQKYTLSSPLQALRIMKYFIKVTEKVEIRIKRIRLYKEGFALVLPRSREKISR